MGLDGEQGRKQWHGRVGLAWNAERLAEIQSMHGNLGSWGLCGQDGKQSMYGCYSGPGMGCGRCDMNVLKVPNSIYGSQSLPRVVGDTKYS